MKYFVWFALVIASASAVEAAPAVNQNTAMGPVQCEVIPKTTPKPPAYDYSPAMRSLAEKYQKQLFSSAEGKELLLKFKKQGQSCSIKVHVKKDGNMNGPITNEVGPIMNEHVKAGCDPKYALQNLLDKLVMEKWNQPNLLRHPLTQARTFEVNITSTGESHVFALQN